MDSAPQRGASVVTPVRRHPKRNDGADGDIDSEIKTLCVVGEKLKKDDKFVASLKDFNLVVVFTT